jgi:hypothetical protein
MDQNGDFVVLVSSPELESSLKARGVSSMLISPLHAASSRASDISGGPSHQTPNVFIRPRFAHIPDPAERARASVQYGSFCTVYHSGGDTLASTAHGVFMHPLYFSADTDITMKEGSDAAELIILPPDLLSHPLRISALHPRTTKYLEQEPAHGRLTRLVANTEVIATAVVAHHHHHHHRLIS